MKHLIVTLLAGMALGAAKAQISPSLYGTWESIPVKREKGSPEPVHYTYTFGPSDTVIFRSYFPNVKFHVKIIYISTPVGPNQIMIWNVKAFQVDRNAETEIADGILLQDPKKLTISKVVRGTMSVAIDYFDGKPPREFGLRPARE